MKPRQQRMLAVGLAAVGVIIATALTLQAMKDSMMFFIEISDVVAGDYPQDRNFRIGGLVVDGSVIREPDSLTVRFDITDNTEVMTVAYTGILPDLFREGQGIVAMGKLQENGSFVAQEVLAKHDENYMPPEVADALKAAEQAAKEKSGKI